MKESTMTAYEANEPSSPSPQTAAVPFPYDVSFPDSAASPAATAFVEQQLAKLSRHFDHITSAKIFVRLPHKHGGLKLFHVHVQLDVPGRTLAVSREPEANDDHASPNLAIKDAFAKLTRQLDAYVATLRNVRV